MRHGFFAEYRRIRELRLDRRGEANFDLHEERGLALTETTSDGGRQEVLGFDARDGLSRIADPAAREVAVDSLERPLPAPLPLEELRRLHGVLAATAAAEGASWVEVLVQEGAQAVAIGREGCAPQKELREWLVVELRAARPNADPLWRCCSYPTAKAFAEDVSLANGRLKQLLSVLPSGARPPPPTGTVPVVLAAGSAAASFIHEVCGHPLEGDVLARRGSYFASLFGQKVAGTHVTVVDDPLGEPESLRYEVDDEGNAARAVHLVERGVVGEPLLDERSAKLLGRSPNGHGRRVSFRHPALPRMAHTRVANGPDDPKALLAGIASGVYVQHLVPRHVNLLTGDFSFFLVESRRIEHGQLGETLGPGVLRGNALQSLAGLEAVGNDGAALLSTRGCRKLDHGPLRVSFGQPTLRFSTLRVEPQP